MQAGIFDVDGNLREITNHGTESFPVGIYLQSHESSPSGKVALHWHEELQFVLQDKGECLYSVARKEYLLSEGEGLFINSACLHSATLLGTDSRYICVNIHPRFLYLSGNEMFSDKYVMPLVSSTLPALHIDGSQPWHEKLCQIISRLVQICEEEPFAYELETQTLAVRAWILILRNSRDMLEDRPVPTAQEQDRLSKMTGYIHEHYPEEIALSDIARSGNISNSECCRFFSRLTGLSPMGYLNNYRIAKSAGLLAAGDKSITNIALLSGFSNASYFSKKFKELMNCTPNEYRKKHSSVNK